MKKNFLAFLAMALCLSFATIGCNNNDDDDNVTPNPDSDFTFQEDNLGYVVTKYIGSSSNVVIPSTYKGKTVHTIGEACFTNEDSELVKTVTIPTSIKTIRKLAFLGCQGLTTIDIPNSVETIDTGAFEVAGLKSITIGTGIKSIGAYLFAGCNNLTNMRIDAVNTPQLDSDIFNDGPQMKEISVPQASLNAYKTANIWQQYSTIMVGH